MNASLVLALAILPWSPAAPPTNIVQIRELPDFRPVTSESQSKDRAAPGDPVITLPAEVKGDPATFIIVTPTSSTGDDIAWFPMDPGISLLPTDLLVRHDIAVVMANKAGKYR